jgi:hypothetical protein
MDPWIVVPGLIIVAVVLVVWPVAMAARGFWAVRRRLICPEVGVVATVLLDRAAIAEVLGSGFRRVRECSCWPERRPCGEECAIAPRLIRDRVASG